MRVHLGVLNAGFLGQQLGRVSLGAKTQLVSIVRQVETGVVDPKESTDQYFNIRPSLQQLGQVLFSSQTKENMGALVGRALLPSELIGMLEYAGQSYRQDLESYFHWVIFLRQAELDGESVSGFEVTMAGVTEDEQQAFFSSVDTSIQTNLIREPNRIVIINATDLLTEPLGWLVTSSNLIGRMMAKKLLQERGLAGVGQDENIIKAFALGYQQQFINDALRSYSQESVPDVNVYRYLTEEQNRLKHQKEKLYQALSSADSEIITTLSNLSIRLL